MTDWWDYVFRIAGREVRQKDIADRLGLEQSAVSRWKRPNAMPSAETVVKFARQYGRPPVEALIAAGYITEQEAGAPVGTFSAADLSTEDLFAEVRMRFDAVERYLSHPVSADEVDGRPTEVL